MPQNTVQSFVITLRYSATGLRAPSMLISGLTEAGFTPTLMDSDGTVYEPGPHTFGFTSTLSAEDVEALSRAIAREALQEEPEVKVMTFEAWLSRRHSQ